MSGRLEIILGCMFSGKSSELIRRLSRYDAVGIKTLIVTSALDTRTGKSVKTHSNISKKALKCSELMSIIGSNEYKISKVIGIDESQFFPDLLKFVLKSEKDNKIVILAGLDGDFNRRPFGQILECIPLCDEVVKLNAIDMISNDGTPAIFSKRVLGNKDQICIGAKGDYIAVSRNNYLSDRNQTAPNK